MKTHAFLFGALLVAAALAGCADEPATPTTPTSTTPASTTPAAATPTATPAATPTAPGQGGPPAPDPRCLAPPAAAPPAANASTRLGMPVLNFTTSDPTDADPCYRFHGPQTAQSGWNVFTLAYPAGGRTFHIMPTFFIGNRTMADVGAALASGGVPEWATPAGAVGGVTPGQSGSVAIDLQPGNYYYFCPIEGHMMQGMMGMLTVTQAANESAAPQADATITLTDYNFTVPELREGMDVIAVKNNGTEPHEAPLIRLNAGANVTDFVHASEDPNATGPPPGALIGGVNAIAPGQTVYLLVDLEADTDYGLLCFVESPSHGGAPHIAIGPMLADFTVKHGEGTAH